MSARTTGKAAFRISRHEGNRKGSRNPSLIWHGFAGFVALLVLLGLANVTLPWLSGSLWGPRQNPPGASYGPQSIPYSSEADGMTGSSDGFNPSFGIFPRGCKWREKAEPGSSKVTYEYWDFHGSTWIMQQPAACRVQSSPRPGPPGWHFKNNTPRTEVRPHESHVVYTNLWYNNGRWYALVDGPKTVSSWRFSRNQEITTLHVSDAGAFAETVDWQLVSGDTMLFDFIYFVHPTAIGHWWEIVGPLFSVLKKVDFKRPCDQFVLLHLKRTHLMEWVRAVLAVALGVPAKQALPTIVLQEETDSAFQQIAMPLEGVPPDKWLVFERALIVRDIFTGGGRTFLTTQDAQEFRKLVYLQYGLPAPAPRRGGVPRTITFQRKRANRRILNEDAFLDLLSQYGKVQAVEFNATSSLLQQLLVVKDTGVYVSVHTSNLANTPFLQPGSAVVEIIQRHWVWNRLDQSFRDQTSKMGDIHHFAWRANHPNETIYLSERDAVKFAGWSKDDCTMEDCVEAHTRVDVTVDLVAFKALLDSRLPLVFAGKSIQEAAIPWPEAT